MKDSTNSHPFSTIQKKMMASEDIEISDVVRRRIEERQRRKQPMPLNEDQLPIIPLVPPPAPEDRPSHD